MTRAMRSARAVWEGCGDDERWISDQQAMVEQILREGFAAGFAAGVRTAAAAFDGAAAAIAANHVLRLPESVPRGLRATAGVVRDIAGDQLAAERAWLEAKGLAGA